MISVNFVSVLVLQRREGFLLVDNKFTIWRRQKGNFPRKLFKLHMNIFFRDKTPTEKTLELSIYVTCCNLPTL
jgi:hypothetical protein